MIEAPYDVVLCLKYHFFAQAKATVQAALRMIQGGDDGTGEPTKAGWTAIELLCRLITVCAGASVPSAFTIVSRFLRHRFILVVSAFVAGQNDFRSEFRAAADREGPALRNINLHEYLIQGSEAERRVGLELVYQLSTHVKALQNVRSFFAVTSFADVPGSRIRKSDLLETVMECICTQNPRRKS